MSRVGFILFGKSCSIDFFRLNLGPLLARSESAYSLNWGPMRFWDRVEGNLWHFYAETKQWLVEIDNLVLMMGKWPIRLIYGLSYGFTYGLTYGLTNRLTYGLNYKLTDRLIYRLNYWLTYRLTYKLTHRLVYGLTYGLTFRQVEGGITLCSFLKSILNGFSHIYDPPNQILDPVLQDKNRLVKFWCL